jgi:hypothetical protein
MNYAGITVQINEKLQDNDAKCSKMGELMFMMNSETVGRPFVFAKKYEKRYFKISELFCDLTKTSRIVLFGIVIVRLICQKFYSEWAPKFLMAAHIHSASRCF